MKSLAQEIAEGGPVSKQGLCSYINETPALLSLLYDINRMPERWIRDQDGPEWRQIELITVAWCINTKELAALKSTAEDLECLLGEAQVENKRLWEWVKALMSLTLGGSEYMDDPARCVAFIRRKEEGLNKAMKRFKDRADKARQEEREACAVIAATYSPPGGYRDDLCKDDRITTGDDIAERIRARGEGSLDKEELEGGEMSEHIKVELDFIPVGERLPEYQVRVVVS